MGYPKTPEDFVEVLTLILLFSGVIALFFHQKQIHFSTVKKCIDDYRKIVRNQQSFNKSETDKKKIKKLFILVKDHLGLVNEELFYMKKGYLPKNLSMDWLNNMLNFIPIYKTDTKRIPVGKPINERAVRNSQELIQFCESDNLNEEENNYDAYLNSIKSFGKINRVFKISEKAYNKLEKPSKDSSLIHGEIELTKKNSKTLLKELWKNIKKIKKS